MANRNKQIKTLGLKNFYSFYKKYLKENNLSDKYNIPSSKVNKILKTFHKEVKQKMLYENMVFILPHFAFRIKIIKFRKKMKNKDGTLRKSAFPVDWKATRQLWKEKPELKAKGVAVYHLNDHSDGYIYTFKMTPKRNYGFKNLTLLKFKPARGISREIKQIVTDPYNTIDYYEL